MVLFVSYSDAFGGAERLLLDFASGLDVERVIACPDGPLAGAARAAGVRVFPLRTRSLELRAGLSGRGVASANLLGHASEVARLARDLRPQLAVAWGMRSAIACMLIRPLPCPVAFHHNDFLPGPLIGRLVRVAAGRAAVVTASSRAIAEELAGLKTHVVHPGVELDRFDPLAKPEQPPQLLVLGTLAGWKRPDLALEVCAAARAERPEVRLRFAGAPLDEQGERLLSELQRRAAQPDLSGAVTFAGAVEESAAELVRASCLLHCAPREPFGIAVLEALAAGRPAIVPAAGGPAEIVDESCGVLYPPGDSEAAARAIVGVLSDPEQARRMGAAGRERAEVHFDAAKARARYASVLGPFLKTEARHRQRHRQRPGLALVTVTHNSAADLRALLASVERHLPGVRVIVVDSNSSDESVAIARSAAAAVPIALTENVGFGRASNRGLQEVHEPVAVLVNPDVELVDDSLLALADEVLRRDRPERLLAPLVLSTDGSRQDSVHPAPGSVVDLLRAVVPPAALPGRFGAPIAPWRASCPRRVGWAVGCAVVARTETLRRLGPFDERIFLYGEDLELGLRAAAAGIETWFWPTGRVIHHGAHSTYAAFGGEPFELLAAARHNAVRRVYGPAKAALDDAAQAVTFASRIVVKRALGRPAERELRQLAALRRVRGSRPTER